MYLTHLECTECHEHHDPSQLQTVCTKCAMPLLAVYDTAAAKEVMARDAMGERVTTMWKYFEMLPAADPVTLGEGGTPLLALPSLAEQLELAQVLVKDESQNPTGSFKARGMSAAVSVAKELGATALAAPSAGNAGGALAAYGARAGLPVFIAMPNDVPIVNRIEADACGANIKLIDGTISDCGKWIKEQASQHGWFDVSTLKEPYRVEGKKTMGYELCEQLGWNLPDVILYPTGGGTGLVGMWKAFAEMRELGWLDANQKLPRMVVVQAAGCAPMVEAFAAGQDHATAPNEPHTIASGLRVPGPIGDRWMLRVLQESKGCAVAVTDEELIEGTRQASRSEGVFFAPEAGALVPALARLRREGWVEETESVVLFNTGAGAKYVECFPT